MAEVIRTLTNAINKLNTLYEGDSTAPSSGEEDFTVWTDLFNTAINLWENEEGMFWDELFGKVQDAADGNKTTTAGDYSYTVPTNFRFPASAYVWLGSGTDKIPFKVIKMKDLQLYENTSGNWCYFVLGNSPTLEFNPNCTIPNAYNINYNYYKFATPVSSGTDEFEMADPMFAVYYALSELNKEEGDTVSSQLATQKLEAMKTRNMTAPEWQEENLMPTTGEGLGG